MKRLFSIFLLLILAVSILQAIPAHRRPMQISQPDGSTITVFQHGDEHFHYTTNEKGEWIERNQQGIYEVIQPLTQDEIAFRRMNSRVPHTKNIQRVAAQTNKVYPLNLAPKGLIILVNFKDLAFQSQNTLEGMQAMANEIGYSYNGATGSARDYFRDQSNGLYEPTFDVYGPVTVDSTMEYYGSNDKNGNDKHAALMIKQACQNADKLFNINFADYDNDHDGYVDWIYVIYAGYGEADTDEENTIWPHTWSLSEEIDPKTNNYISLSLDGVVIDDYACSSELDYDGNRSGIGTLCHEFSHVLGLPDIYETTGNGDWKTLGEWDIMDYGNYNNESRTPSAFSAYEKFFFGWITPMELTESQSVTLHELQESNEAYIFCPNGKMQRLQGNDPYPATFYILENVQKTGWNTYVPGHGLILMKILYSYAAWYDNIVNNNEKVQGIDLIEADGKAPYYPSDDWYGKKKDAFPAGATSYSFGIQSLQNITENNGIITFDFFADEAELENIEKHVTDDILAIYTLLGQKVCTNDLSELSAGVYIIETDEEFKKISIK